MTPTEDRSERDTARTARRTKSSREPYAGDAASGRAGAEDAGDLLTVEGLALEQGARQRVELLDVVLEDLLGAARGVHHDPFDLGAMRSAVASL